MNVDLMRKVDYYAGVPLCFLATFIVKLSQLFSSAGKPKRVLLVELSEMGSAILVDPAMQKLKNVAGAELFFVIFDKNKPSLKLLNSVEDQNIFTIRETGIIPLAIDTLRFFWWTRSRKIDSVIDLELFSRYSALLTGLSGASNRVGFHAFHNEGLYRGAMLTHKVSYNAHQHIAKSFVGLVNALLSDKAELPYSKTIVSDDEIKLRQAVVSAEQKAAILAKIREDYADFDAAKQQLVLINPNASELLPQRRWMKDRYAELMRRILAHSKTAIVVITGAPAERAEAEALRVAVDNARCINFAGRVKFTELPPLYSVSRLMVTNDSGPGHFSSVTPLQTFVLFGPETPALYGSLGNSTPIYAGLACSPCVSASNHRKTACSDNVCLQAISVDKVFNTISPLLPA
ncbi:MAG: glycosyltransferase family 9 protein [Gallionellaceae bacterium]|jgi:ADP-heptose:LPS heptosyltransferase